MKTLTLQKEQDFLDDWQKGIVSNDDLYNQYRDLIRFFVWRKTPPYLRDDCFQECVCEMFRIAKEYDPKRGVKFTTFLLSELRAITTGFYRSYRAAQKFENLEIDTIPVCPKEDELFAYKLRAAISALNERERELIILLYFREKQATEAAKIIGIPRGSIHALEQKALRKLRVILCPQSEEEEREKRIAKKLSQINFDDI